MSVPTEQLAIIADHQRIARIFELLAKIEAEGTGSSSEALAWAYQRVREDAATLDWRRRQGDWRLSGFARHVSQLTGYDRDAVAAIGASAIHLSKAALVVEELEAFDRQNSRGGRQSLATTSERWAID